MKANQTTQTTELKSIKDAAYRFARTGETTSEIARFIVERDPSFPGEVSSELKADLNAGFMLRANELWGQDVYKIGDQGTFIKVANTLDHAESLVSTADAAYAYATARLKATRAGLPVAS